MALYTYPNDGKIHTRYSELKSCTLGQIDQVITERLYPESKFQSTFTVQGDDRHRSFQEESLRTHFTPECFDNVLYGALPLTTMEVSICNELWDNVCLWSTPDAYAYNPTTGKGYLVDYKTANVNVERKLKKEDKRQMTIYALQLSRQGITIQRGCLLVESWESDDFGNRYAVAGYTAHWFDITPEMIEEAWQWLETRVTLLITALRTPNNT